MGRLLTVTQSNRIEELAAAIADALPVGDPFAEATVVVSDRLVARWLQYELARRRGVAGGVALPFLEPFLDGVLSTDGLRGLDRPRLAALCASALADPALLAEPVMAPVRRYLGDDDGVRRVQLANRAASHLWDYALTRPDWLDAWDEGRAADLADSENLGWQRRLYTAVARAGWTLVPRLPQARRRLGLPPPKLRAPVHVVGFSYLARAHVEALRVLDGDVHVAMVTPCAEYWEDVPGRKARTSKEEPAGLVLWGGPGRDTASMLLTATDGNVAERFTEPSRDTALDAWARDLLHRAAPASSSAGRSSGGITVHACPSVRRELEIVGSEIWRRLREDPGLRASQIAMLIAADHDRYLAQVGPVLGGLHGLPFHVVDAPAAGTGRVAEAALQLLELPLGRFTRREVLALITHPAVLPNDVDPADWVRWCEHLGIVHGADARDHAGTYLANEQCFHWDQGLRRLGLGAFVAGQDPVHVGGRDLLPEALTADQQASASAFALLVRSLIADARWLVERSEPLARWADILAALIETYLQDDDGARARVTDELRALAALDLDGRSLPYREVVELARTRIGALRESRGEALAHGVMVAPLDAMRPLPFEITFVLGLGEGGFPALDRPSPLDLRTQRRRGDVGPRDRDRYGFLEALLAARREVVLSYVARDEQSGEKLAPSSVIHELAEQLEPYVGKLPTFEHPLRRWDDGPTSSVAPAAVRERHAVEVRQSLDAHLRSVGRSAPDAPRLRELLAAPELEHVRAALRLDLIDGVAAPADDDAPIVLSLATLRGFLESPVQAWARTVLRLEAGESDEDAEAADREDEPFDVDGRDRASALREAMALVLGGMEPDAAHARVRTRRELASRGPRGPFGEAAARRDRVRLAQWRGILADRGELGPWQRIAFGRAGMRDAALHRAIALEVGGRRVEIVGTTELMTPQTSLVLVNNAPDHEHHLRHAIDHLALSAAGLIDGARTGLVLGAETAVRRLGAWTADEARAHLALLAGELLGGPHAYLLPYDTARNALDGKITRPRRDEHRPPLGWGPLDRDPGLAIPEDAIEIARRRLGPIAQRLLEDK